MLKCRAIEDSNAWLRNCYSFTTFSQQEKQHHAICIIETKLYAHSFWWNWNRPTCCLTWTISYDHYLLCWVLAISDDSCSSQTKFWIVKAIPSHENVWFGPRKKQKITKKVCQNGLYISDYKPPLPVTVHVCQAEHPGQLSSGSSEQMARSTWNQWIWDKVTQQIFVWPPLLQHF